MNTIDTWAQPFLCAGVKVTPLFDWLFFLLKQCTPSKKIGQPFGTLTNIFCLNIHVSRTLQKGRFARKFPARSRGFGHMFIVLRCQAYIYFRSANICTFLFGYENNRERAPKMSRVRARFLLFYFENVFKSANISRTKIGVTLTP